MNSPSLTPSTTASSAEETTGLQIGNRQLPSRYFLAPLAGYTHLAFRTAIRELGGLGLATTDLVLAGHLVKGTRKSRRLVITSPADNPLSVQIFSSKVEDLIAAARWLEDHGYGGVDLNMGCPMAKINSQGGGARLMCDVQNAQEIAHAVVNAVTIPVTVKMRLGWDRHSIVAPELARAFEEVGIAAVTIHGRTRAQGFHGSVHLEPIRDAVQAVKSMPIIGNGDVLTVEDALQMRRFTGCAAVAIGRGAMLDPWIFRKLAEHSAGNSTPAEPTADEQIDFLVRHFWLMTEQHDEYSCVLFRKFAGWYGARLGIPEDLEDRLRRMERYSDFETIVEQIRQRHGERKTSLATALIKVPNGPVEHW
ncbi:MAG: tRNA dihydrouridine synthase DusB [Planctomycetaceae bacterium]